jgi:protein phosphatase
MKKSFVALALAPFVTAGLVTGCDSGVNRPSQPSGTMPTTSSGKPARREDAGSREGIKPAERHVPGLRIGRSSLLGNFRNSNDHELAVHEFTAWTVCLVADGIGGIGVGEVGSKHAVDVLVRELKAKLPEAPGADAVERVIRGAMIAANDELISLGQRDKKLMNAGSSVVAAAWKPGERMYIAGLGDCRAYRIHKGEIKQLTVDHSLAQALVEKGTITAEQAKAHRFRNVLWKYLGTRESREGPEVQAASVGSGDRLLLCTRGLTGVVNDEELLRCVRDHTNVQECAEALTALGLFHNSRDNVSCMVLTVTAE